MYCKPIHFDSSVLNVTPFNTPEHQKSTRYFIDTVIEVVCRYYGLGTYELKCKSHKRTYSDARSVAIHLIDKYAPRMSLKEIGKLFSGRHHSTVIHAKNKFKDLYDTDQNFKADYKRIEKSLNRQFKKDEVTLITETINN